MMLKDSLIHLMKEKPISSITVKEICEVADINRSTFYSHFSDQFDLLNKIEGEIIEEMNATLNQYNYTKEEEVLKMTEKLLEYVADNSEICQTLFSEHGDTSFPKRVMLVAQQITAKTWTNTNNVDKNISEYIGTFVVSGSIHIIKSWLDKGMDKTPKEMAEIIIKLTNKGIASF